MQYELGFIKGMSVFSQSTSTNAHCFRFESFADWMEALKKNGMKCAHYELRDILTNSTWRGRKFSSMDELKAADTIIWEEGRQQYEEAKARLLQFPIEAPKNITRRRRFNEYEGDVNIDRYMGGDVEFFEDCERSSLVGSKVVTLAIGIGNSGGYSPRELFANAAAAIALADILESAGYSVEIIGYYAGNQVYHGKYDGVFASMVAKEAGTPLNTDAVIAILSAFAFRTLAFMTMNLKATPIDSGYGYPVHLSKDEVIRLAQLNGLVFNLKNMASEQEAIAACYMVLRELNGQAAAE